MDREAFLNALVASLQAVRHPRYYTDERAFQGALLVELSEQIPEGVMPADGIIQQEPQKTLAQHGLNQRPDIIVHVPYDETCHAGPEEGNHAVIELKRQGSRAKALEDFRKLERMPQILQYPLGVFINIASDRSFEDVLPEQLRGRVACYA